MLKFLVFVIVVAGLYFMSIGFLHTFNTPGF